MSSSAKHMPSPTPFKTLSTDNWLYPFQQTLSCFGLGDEQIKTIQQLDGDKKDKLIQVLTDLELIFQLKQEEKVYLNNLRNRKNKLNDAEFREYQLRHQQMGQLTDYAIINWSQVLFDLHKGADLTTTLSSAATLSWNRQVEKTNLAMSWVLFGLSIYGLALTMLGTQTWYLGGINNKDPSIGVSAGSNYLDALGGIIVGLRMIKQGEVGLGVTYFMTSAQTITSTIITMVSKLTSALPQLSNAAVLGGLMGFAMAAGMAVSFGIELTEARKCQDRIQFMERKLTDIQLQMRTSSNREPLLRQVTSLEKMILFEKAKKQSHLRNANSWAGCTVAMATVAIISYIGLSSITFGALPAATVVFAAAAFAVGIVRRWWASRKDYIANAKLSITHNLLHDLKEVISEKKHEIDFEKKITGHHEVLFIQHKQTLRSYLEEMAIHAPHKLEDIIKVLKSDNKDLRDKILNEQCHYGAKEGKQDIELTPPLKLQKDNNH